MYIYIHFYRLLSYEKTNPFFGNFVVDAVPMDNPNDAGWLPKAGVPDKEFVHTLFGFNTKLPYFSFSADANDDANDPNNEGQQVDVCERERDRERVSVCVCLCFTCVYVCNIGVAVIILCVSVF